MHILFFTLLVTFILSQCSPKDYPQLIDGPNYTPPSISLKQAQKEIEELKSERATTKPL